MLAIFIAALGLFGLASYSSEQRTKEIGIRKVLGAQVGNLLFVLSKEFALLIVLSNFFAWPIAYYTMNTYWLQDFPYQQPRTARISAASAVPDNSAATTAPNAIATRVMAPME